MELAIYGATTLAVLFWISSIIPIYKGRETWVIWTVYFALVFTLLAFFLTWQKRVWESQKTAIPVERPELFIEKAFVRLLEPGKPETAVFLVRNRGKVSAHNISFENHFTVVSEPFDGPLKYWGHPQPDTRTNLGPGGEVTLIGQGINTLSLEWFRSLRSGTMLLFHFGKARYEDSLGNEYPLKYCYLYDPTHVAAMRISPTKYWPEERPDSELLSVTERPIVVVETCTARPLVAGHSRAVSLVLRNRGTKSARNITVSITQALTPSDFLGPLKFVFTEPDSRPDCEPNATISLLGESSSPITEEDIQALHDKKKLWFHYGKGVYEDDLKNVYPLDFFCFIYEPTIRSMGIAPDRYWPNKANVPHRVIQPRPELSLEKAKVMFRSGKPAIVRIFMLNGGSLTAYNVGFSGVQIITDSSFAGPLRPGPPTEPDMFPSLAVGAGIQGTTQDGAVLSSKDITDIEAGKRLFFCYGRGRYEDEAGNRYPLNLCLMYIPGLPGLEDELAIAPRQYWPQEQNG